jgi:uncharacterized protein YbjT (DUF2867 family)
MSNSILITGASGNIGQPLVRELQALGADFAIMRSQSQPATTSDAVATRVGNFADVASLTQAFTGIDTVFLLFPLVEEKLQFAKNAAAAAVAAGVKHIVRSSGAGADAKSDFALPRLQGQIDDVLAATKIPTTFLRPGGFMQNYGNYHSQAIKDGTIYMADAQKAQALIDARDIASVAATVLTNPAAHAGRVYWLTGAEEFTGVQAAQTISAAINKSVQHVSVSTTAARETMNQWGMPVFLVDVMDSLNQIVSAGYASGVSSDVASLLGRPPRSFKAYAAEQAGLCK